MSENNNRSLKEHIVELQCPAHGGLIVQTAEKYGLDPEMILDLSASLNPIGTPFDHPSGGLMLEDVLGQAIEKMQHYPDNRYPQLRSAAASFIGGSLTAENIVPGNGSCEIMRLVAECMVDENDIVLIPHPTFNEYEQQCKITGARVHYITQEGIFDIEEGLLERAKLLFVCNPNNPTGILHPGEKLLELAKRCAAKDTFLFVDEAFIELSDPSQSVAAVVADHPNMLVLRSLTKDFAVPGVRLGFGVACTQLAEKLNTARLSWNLGSLADAMGTALLNMEGGSYSDYLKTSRQTICKEREYLIEKMSGIRKFKPIPGDVNYILVDLEDSPLDSVELTGRLAQKGILIRDCSSFPSMGNRYVRIAVRPREETDRLSTALGEVVVEKARDTAKENLGSLLDKGIRTPQGGNRECPYYPCHHFPDQDCTFCFCPFYPCKDTRTGGKWVDRSSGGSVWSCEDCTIVHEKEFVQHALDILHEEGDLDDKLKKVWEKVMEPRL